MSASFHNPFTVRKHTFLPGFCTHFDFKTFTWGRAVSLESVWKTALGFLWFAVGTEWFPSLPLMWPFCSCSCLLTETVLSWKTHRQDGVVTLITDHCFCLHRLNLILRGEISVNSPKKTDLLAIWFQPRDISKTGTQVRGKRLQYGGKSCSIWSK